MKTRTSSTITFRRPFALTGTDELLPAGAYSVETEDELIEGVPYLAYRRLSTLLRPRPLSDHAHLTGAMTVDPDELEAALARDERSAERRQAPRGNARRTSAVAQWIAPKTKE